MSRVKTLNQLIENYTDINRHYHNLTHIHSMLRHKDKLTPNQIIAVWWHDVIYVPGAKDNEERSAEDAAEYCKSMLDMRDDDIQAIKQMILDTKTHIPTIPDSELIIDFDLEILASNPDNYQEYTEQIRKEYSFVPDDLWKKGRGDFLTTFLKRDKIYYKTTWLEERARANLANELSRL